MGSVLVMDLWVDKIKLSRVIGTRVRGPDENRKSGTDSTRQRLCRVEAARVSVHKALFFLKAGD